MDFLLACFFLHVAMPVFAYFWPKVHQLSWWDTTFTVALQVVQFSTYLALVAVAICVILALLLALGGVLIIMLRFAFDVARFINKWR
jgi:ABC-type Fe3+ transport system permease subunit